MIWHQYRHLEVLAPVAAPIIRRIGDILYWSWYSNVTAARKSQPSVALSSLVRIRHDLWMAVAPLSWFPLAGTLLTA
jgi:hypothetical protein